MVPVPIHLHFNGRVEDQKFTENDNLYHGYVLGDYDTEQSIIRTETIRFPDFSCNWCKYSNPEDVRHRAIGLSTDGCYSFNVGVARYNNMATPVHDPLDDVNHPNYSHVEVRSLRNGEDPENYVPERGRKLRGSKSKKLEYRQNLVNKLNITIFAIA